MDEICSILKDSWVAKLYMTQGQIHQPQGGFAATRNSFAAGLRAYLKEVNFGYLRLDWKRQMGRVSKQALLEKGLINRANEIFWVEAIGVEECSGGAVQAKAMLARGM
jgi:pre-mRNA-processing factor 6